MTRCNGQNGNGLRCNMPARTGGYCGIHHPDLVLERLRINVVRARKKLEEAEMKLAEFQAKK